MPIFYVTALCIVAGLLFALDNPLYAFIQATPSAQVHPFGQSTAGDVGIPIIYLALVAIATFGLGFVVRKRIRKRASLVVAVLFGIMGIVSSILIFWFLPPWMAEAIDMTMYSLFILSVAKKLPPWATLPYLTFIGASSGIVFVVTLPTISVVVLLAIFAAWDIFAVFRGPLKKLVENMPAQMLVMMMANLGQAKLGLGDVVFYSMTIGLANALGGAGSMLAYWVSVSVVVGFGITALLIQRGKAKVLPGLPLPIFLSLCTVAVFVH